MRSPGHHGKEKDERSFGLHNFFGILSTGLVPTNNTCDTDANANRIFIRLIACVKSVTSCVNT